MNKLNVFNTEIIPVYTTAEGNKVVMARELHKNLGIQTKYKDWFPRQCEYGFQENSDFEVLLKNELNSKVGRPQLNHIISLDMAKHIAMIQRTPIGFKIRQKLIELEKDQQFELPSTLWEALRLSADLAEEKERLQIENNEMKPKAEFADAVSASNDSIMIGDLAKLLRQNGYNTGRNRLFEELRDQGYLQRRNGEERNRPTQRSIESGWLVVKETVRTDAVTGEERINVVTKVTPKGQQYFIRLFLQPEQKIALVHQ